MIKSAAILGASFAAGNAGGNIIASKVGATSDSTRLGIKVATGIVAFFVLSAVVG